jgi:D-alanyl-D-alanine carboxypeptidase/D-alanyl-D-alanine-endopeptidase (penicillin-binding protein 4)
MRRVRARLPLACALTFTLIAFAPGLARAGPQTVEAAAAPAGWEERIDDLVAGHAMSVVVGYQGDFLYRHRAGVRRTPASNEKLLLSMAILDAMGPDVRLPTRVRAENAPDGDGVIEGNVWIVGRGDPRTGKSEMIDLAKQMKQAGIERVHGRVMGSTSYFSHDWWAVGWKDDFPAEEIPLPTALTWEGNVGPNGGHIDDPEHRAATSLLHQLEGRGIPVSGKPGVGDPGNGLTTVAKIESVRMQVLLRKMNVASINFYAEVLGKGLGAEISGPPGTIVKGANAISTYEDANGVKSFTHHDCSGLSYANRVTASGIVKLLWVADDASWLENLRAALPRRGQGTLVDRLKGVRVRAKTGTLDGISALSGWVWLKHEKAWAEFSILSKGMSKTAAVKLEDSIARIVQNNAAV